MKATIPRSVKLDAHTEARLALLLKASEGNGIKFPTVINLALAQLLDRLESGECIVFDGTRLRLSSGRPTIPHASLALAANQAADEQRRSRAKRSQPNASQA